MIKRAEIEDAAALAVLAVRMWTSHTPDELAAEFRELIQKDDAVCFLKCIGGQAGRVRAVPAPARLRGGHGQLAGRLSGRRVRRGSIPQKRNCRGAAGGLRTVGERKGLHRVRQRLRTRQRRQPALPSGSGLYGNQPDHLFQKIIVDRGKPYEDRHAERAEP